jgi:hypothetical protein
MHWEDQPPNRGGAGHDIIAPGDLYGPVGHSTRGGLRSQVPIQAGLAVSRRRSRLRPADHNHLDPRRRPEPPVPALLHDPRRSQQAGCWPDATHLGARPRQLNGTDLAYEEPASITTRLSDPMGWYVCVRRSSASSPCHWSRPDCSISSKPSPRPEFATIPEAADIGPRQQVASIHLVVRRVEP